MGLSLFVGTLALLAASPSGDVAPPPDPAAALIDRATLLVRAAKPREAIPLLDEAIAIEAGAHGAETRQIRCARSPAEALIYAGMGVAAKRDTVILGPEWADALFMKGFALIDLGDSDAALPLFVQAIALSPMNAHYLGEAGEWYKSRHDWDHAYAMFERAATAADMSPAPMQSFDRRRAWRGMGYVHVEQKRYDEAEAFYRKCLDLDPGDAMARAELGYIAKQRAGPT